MTIYREAQCIVVNVEYRLAPEFKFPAPYDDAVVVVNWAKANKERLGNAVSTREASTGVT